MASQKKISVINSSGPYDVVSRFQILLKSIIIVKYLFFCHIGFSLHATETQK